MISFTQETTIHSFLDHYFGKGLSILRSLPFLDFLPLVMLIFESDFMFEGKFIDIWILVNGVGNPPLLVTRSHLIALETMLDLRLLKELGLLDYFEAALTKVVSVWGVSLGPCGVVTLGGREAVDHYSFLAFIGAVDVNGGGSHICFLEVGISFGKCVPFCERGEIYCSILFSGGGRVHYLSVEAGLTALLLPA